MSIKMPDNVVVNAARDISLAVGQASREIILRFCFSFLTVLGLLWLAILMYLGFYYAYMPTVRHVKPVHLQFQSDCSGTGDDGQGICSFPDAQVSLSKGERMLMRGQKYQVYLDLEMPNSPVNERLGMFMVKMTFLSESGKVLAKSERSAMFHYRSSLLKTLTTMFYSLPMIVGLSEEKQVVSLRLFDDYLEDSYHPAVSMAVTIFSRQIEIYSSSIRIEACFSGLRYIMFNWPVGSAAVAIASNFLVFCLVYFLAYGTFTPESLYAEDPISHDVAPETAAQERQQPPEQPRLWTRITSPSQNGRLRKPRKPRKHAAHCRFTAHSSASASPQTCRCSPEVCRAAAMLRSATFPPYRWADPSAEPAGQVSDPAALAVCRGCACESCAGRVEWLEAGASSVGGFSVGSASPQQSPRKSCKVSSGTKRRRHLKRHRVMYLSDPETERSRVVPLYDSTQSLSDQGEAVHVMHYDAVRYCNTQSQRTPYSATSSSISSSPERQNHCCAQNSRNSVYSGNSKGAMSKDSRQIVGDQAQFSSGRQTIGVLSEDSRQSFGDPARFSSGQRTIGVLSANTSEYVGGDSRVSSGQSIRGTLSTDSRRSVGDEARVLSGRRSPFSTTAGSLSVSEGSYEVPDGTPSGGTHSLNGRRVPDGAPSNNDPPSSTAMSLVSDSANQLAQVVEESPVVRRRSVNRARAKFGLALRNMLPSKKK